jgi:carboxymethylenebutenolidase
MGHTIEIPARDGGAFAAYRATPATLPAPGLVLMQYICGVNRVMRDIADRFAALGYLAAVPDLFWRQEPNVALIDDPAHPTPEEEKRSLELNAGFDDAAAVSDLQATVDWLRRSPDCTGKVGGLGYCLGGRIAYLMAARTDADCSVGYYGVNIDHYLSEASHIARPLLLHIAGSDILCPPPVQAKIGAALKSQPSVRLETYPGAGHAFALDGGRNFDAAAAALANRRSEAFLAENLRAAG